MDSGATHHITPHCSDFITYQSVKGTICLSDKQGTVISQLGVSTAVFISPEGICITLKDTIYAPNIGNCILSLGSILDKGQAFFSTCKALTLLSIKKPLLQDTRKANSSGLTLTAEH